MLCSEFSECANRFIQWDRQQAIRQVAGDELNKPNPLFNAILAEKLAQQPQNTSREKAKFLQFAVFDYVRAEEFDSVRHHYIPLLVETNEYQYVRNCANKLYERNISPLCSAVLYEAAARMLSNEHQIPRQELINELYYRVVYCLALGGKLSGAKEFANGFLERIDLKDLMSWVENKPNSYDNPRYFAIIHELIVRKFLANRPSTNEKGAIITYYATVSPYFKLTSYLYANANEHDHAKVIFDEFKSFFEMATPMLLSLSENELDTKERQTQLNQLNQLNLLQVYFNALNKPFTLVKPLADSICKDIDLRTLLSEAVDNFVNPLYGAILYEIIISKAVLNKPSSNERGVVKRYNDKLNLYYKSAIHLYAKAGEIEQLKVILSAYIAFDESGRLLALLQQNDDCFGAETAIILSTLESVLQAEGLVSSTQSMKS